MADITADTDTNINDNANKLSIYAPARINFKSEKLKEYTIRIAEIGVDVQDRARELCKVFANVASSKCYEDDGYKSVADYAQQVFGIAKSQAYQFAKVGQRFYLNDSASEAVKAIAETCAASNLAELVSLTDKEIEESGITGTETQKQLREKAKAAKAPKSKVYKLMDIKARFFDGADGAWEIKEITSMTIPIFESNYGLETIESKRFSDGMTVYYDSESGKICIAHFAKHDTSKDAASHVGAVDSDWEELKAQLAALQAQNAALQAQLNK